MSCGRRRGPLEQQRSVSRILAAGKALHFDDDVVVAETGYRQPYVQIRGDFMLQLGETAKALRKGLMAPVAKSWTAN